MTASDPSAEYTLAIGADYTYDAPESRRPTPTTVLPRVSLNVWCRAPNSKGKERDTETGNDDFGARYYSNRFGRWLSADWSAVPAPVPYANLINPQTLNLYAMVADDPESFADLDGHLTMNSGSGPCNGENESNCNSPAPPPAPQGQNQTAQPAQQ